MRFIIGSIGQYFRELWCRIFGHNLEGESSVGPDSGSEEITCTRCGWYENITYY